MAYLMIIDDDEDFARATAKVLQSIGHDVAIELSPTRAMERMKQRPPDLVILDVMFPEDCSGGFVLARKMRRPGNKLSHTPILMLTAINSRFALGFGLQDIDAAIPVDDFIEKPMDFELLKRKVTELLPAAPRAFGIASRPAPERKANH